MRAKNIILTYFSQRYPKLPILSAVEENRPEVLIALDLCRVRLGDVKRFGVFIPALKELYEEADEEKIEGEKEVEEESVVDEKKGKVGKARGYKPGGNKSEKKSDKRA